MTTFQNAVFNSSCRNSGFESWENPFAYDAYKDIYNVEKSVGLEQIDGIINQFNRFRYKF